MKKMLTRLHLVITMVAFGMFAFYLHSCEMPQDDNVAPENATGNTARKNKVIINLLFVNINTGSPLQPKNVALELIDPDGLVELAGGAPAGTVVSTNNGIISLAVPNEKLPYNFSYHVNANGFVKASRNVFISEPRNATYTIALLPQKQSVQGISVLQNRFGEDFIKSGQVTQTIYVTTEGESKERLSIKIPEGVVLLNADGKQIEANDLEIRARHYATSSREALGALPAPLFTPNVTARGEQLGSLEEPVNFMTLGMTTVDMWAGGEEVKFFSDPIYFEFELNPDGTALENQPLEEGMTVPVWSWNEETATWEMEGESAEFTRGDNDRLVAVAEVTHLSTWNLDYWTGNRCPNGSVNLTVNAPPGTYTFDVVSAATGQSVSDFSRKSFTVPASGTEVLEMVNVPDPAEFGDMIIVMYDEDGNVIGSTPLTSCNDPQPIFVNPLTPPCVDIIVECLDGSPVPEGLAVAYSIGADLRMLGVVVDGRIRVCNGFENGQIMRLVAFVNGSATINNYAWGSSNNSNGNFIVVASGGNLTFRVDCD